ncbi:MAG: hypothetical protein LBC72_03790 [Spirochaetaceae bacterium]|nr:hypothetical protein [Spirochaetaceae bacterium]
MKNKNALALNRSGGKMALAVLAIPLLVLVLCGCPDELKGADMSGGLAVPKPDALPPLPNVARAVETAAGAEAFLLSFHDITYAAGLAIKSVIDAKSRASEIYDVKNVEKGGFHISASRTETKASNAAALPVFNQGDYTKSTEKKNSKAALIKDMTDFNLITILKNSSFESLEEFSKDMTVTTGGGIATVQYKGAISGTKQYVLAFSAVNADGEGAKIVLDARRTVSAPFSGVGTRDLLPIIMYIQQGVGTAENTKERFSGSLAVYGANDERLYEIQIADKLSYNEAIAPFELDLF